MDLFVIDSPGLPPGLAPGSPPQEWLVGLDDSGMLTVQRTDVLDQLLPSVRDALMLHEVARGQPRVLAVESLHILEVYGLDQAPDVPGLDDPVRLYGALLGPLAAGASMPAQLQRLEGQLAVTRGDVLQGFVAGAHDAFLHADPATDRSVRTLHMLLPGDRPHTLAQGRGAVLAYAVAGSEAAGVGPGNESLIAEIVHDIVAAIWREIPHFGDADWRDPISSPCRTARCSSRS
jgi:hypothetical protein